MTTLYARSDLREVLTTRGQVYKVRKHGDHHIVEADPQDVAELLSTGSLVERSYDVPKTFDEIQEAERLERDGTAALQAAARQIAKNAAEAAGEELAAKAAGRRSRA